MREQEIKIKIPEGYEIDPDQDLRLHFGDDGKIVKHIRLRKKKPKYKTIVSNELGGKPVVFVEIQAFKLAMSIIKDLNEGYAKQMYPEVYEALKEIAPQALEVK